MVLTRRDVGRIALGAGAAARLAAAKPDSVMVKMVSAAQTAGEIIGFGISDSYQIVVMMLLLNRSNWPPRLERKNSRIAPPVIKASEKSLSPGDAVTCRGVPQPPVPGLRRVVQMSVPPAPSRLHKSQTPPSPSRTAVGRSFSSTGPVVPGIGVLPIER